LELDYL